MAAHCFLEVVCRLVYPDSFQPKGRPFMSYQVLARKWRPKLSVKWSARARAAEALVNATGPRSPAPRLPVHPAPAAGKTTIARILASASIARQGELPSPVASVPPVWR